MAKWDFKIVGASFVKELAPVGDDVNPRSQSFMQPSFDLEGDKIVMKESGQYKTAILFTQIGEIDGVAPTDLEDAYAKLLVLVENFNGGGGAPGTTPNLPQVLTIGDRTLDIPGTRNFQIDDRTKYLLSFAGETLTLNESVIDFPANSLLQFRALDEGVSLAVVGTLCFYLDGILPITSLNLYAGDYCELKKISSGNWVLTVSSGAINAIQRGVFSGAFALSNATRGGEYTPLAQSGALTLSVGASAVTGGVDSVKITSNGSAITVPGGWINIGSDSISVVNGAVNRIMVRQYQNEIWYTVKVS